MITRIFNLLDIETPDAANADNASELAKAESENSADKKQEDSNKNSQAHKTKTGKTVRVDIDRLDVLMNLVSELIIIKTRLEGLEDRGKNKNYNEAVEYLERITTSLHDAVMKVRMVPVEMVLTVFQG